MNQSRLSLSLTKSRLASARVLLASPGGLQPGSLSICVSTACSLQYLLEKAISGDHIVASNGTYDITSPVIRSNLNLVINGSSGAQATYLDFRHSSQGSGWRFDGVSTIEFNSVIFTQLAPSEQIGSSSHRYVFSLGPDVSFSFNQCKFISSPYLADGTLFELESRSSLTITDGELRQLTGYQMASLVNATLNIIHCKIIENALAIVTATDSFVAFTDSFYYHNHPNFNFTDLTPFYMYKSRLIFTRTNFLMNQFGPFGMILVQEYSIVNVTHTVVEQAISLGPLIQVIRGGILYVQDSAFLSNTAGRQMPSKIKMVPSLIFAISRLATLLERKGKSAVFHASE